MDTITREIEKIISQKTSKKGLNANQLTSRLSALLSSGLLDIQRDGDLIAVNGQWIDLNVLIAAALVDLVRPSMPVREIVINYWSNGFISELQQSIAEKEGIHDPD